VNQKILETRRPDYSPFLFQVAPGVEGNLRNPQRVLGIDPWRQRHNSRPELRIVG
jgi:hypothetical protein